VAILLMVVVLLVLDLAAPAFGADSRDGNDWARRDAV
jgi:hypothetical protein